MTQMSDIIEISCTDTALILKGDIDKIKSNRFAMMYLRRNLSFICDSDYIQIQIESDINSLMEDVKILAEYAKCSLAYDSNVLKEIQEYENEEQKFLNFSRKARDIRDNKPIVSEFQIFKDILQKNMKARRLYPLQLLSAYHMAFAQNSCNFSVPGAGKTSVVYGAYCYLKHLPIEDPKHVDRLLIVGPLSSFGPWESEYQECFGQKPSIKRLVGSEDKEKKRLYLHGLDLSEITVISYQSVVSLKEDLIYFLANNRVMVVLDEAHKIKNSQGAITAASTLELAQYAKARIVLTGTPAPNGYEDLYNLFHFIWPNKDILSYNVGQLENMTHSASDSRVDDLIEKISPFFIRIKKSDLKIPQAFSHHISVKMSDSQRAIYDVIEKRVIQALQDGKDSVFINKIRQAKLIRLMQVATNPELLFNTLEDSLDETCNGVSETEEDKIFIQNILSFVKSEIPEKFKKASEITKNILSEGGKVVIWATFIKNIDALAEYFESIGIAVRKLYGATPIETEDSVNESELQTRERIVKEFNSDNSSFHVIIANPFAVAESISLHKKCHNAIYLERTFNAAHFIQSKDRIHRYGLAPDIETHYYYLISEDSIDETIDERLSFKEQRLNEIMESMPIPLFDNALQDGGNEDIKAIIRDYVQRTPKL